MRRKKVLLISLDALGESDLDMVKTLPNFSKIMEEGAWCSQETSVYPSLTFPSHASIVTGCVPASHGIVNNYMLLPFEKLPRWNSFASNLKRKAIWDYAETAGKRVLSMSWPVSAGAKMAYSMPEMAPAKPKIWNMSTFFAQLNVLRKYGTPGFAVKTLLSRKGLPKAWFLGQQPQLDKAMMQCFEEAIQKADFDIALLHIYGMDDAKHSVGIHGEKIDSYLRVYDSFIGRLMDYCKKRPDENIVLMITGDHGQKNVAHAIYGNMILEDMGLAVYKNGSLTDYKVYMDSCDGMAYLYVKDGENPDLAVQAAKQFAALDGVKMVMERSEFAELGCDTKAAIVLEAADGYFFESGYEKDALAAENHIIEGHYKGVHGYLPDTKGYRTMFFCYGEDVVQREISSMSIIDILPSLLDWMGIEGDPEMDGTKVAGLWKQEG